MAAIGQTQASAGVLGAAALPAIFNPGFVGGAAALLNPGFVGPAAGLLGNNNDINQKHD